MKILVAGGAGIGCLPGELKGLETCHFGPAHGAAMGSRETPENGRLAELDKAAADFRPIIMKKALEPDAGSMPSVRKSPVLNTAGHFVMRAAITRIVARRVCLAYRLIPFHSQPLPQQRKIRPESNTLTKQDPGFRRGLGGGGLYLSAPFDHTFKSLSDNRSIHSGVITRAMNSGARNTSEGAVVKNKTALVSISLDGDLIN